MKTTQEILDEIERRGFKVAATRAHGASGARAWVCRIDAPGEDGFRYRFGSSFAAALIAAYEALPVEVRL